MSHSLVENILWFHVRGLSKCAVVLPNVERFPEQWSLTWQSSHETTGYF